MSVAATRPSRRLVDPSEPERDRPETALRTTARYARDGQPAAHANLTLWSLVDTTQGVRRFTTDASAFVRIALVEGGKVLVVSECGGEVQCTVRTGDEHAAVLEIPPGVDVKGRVVTADHAAVPNALICLADRVMARQVACEGVVALGRRNPRGRRWGGSSLP